MSENKDSATGVYLGEFAYPSVEFSAGRDKLWNTPGSFLWGIKETGERILFASLPNGCYSEWHIRPAKNEGGHSWAWDGNKEKPTLTPSLHAVGIWHGFLRGGRFESV